MAVSIRSTPTSLEPSPAVPLFDIRVPIGGGYRQQYDVTGDGQRFLVNTFSEELVETPITVVVNWTAGIKK